MEAEKEKRNLKQDDRQTHGDGLSREEQENLLSTEKLGSMTPYLRLLSLAK